MTITKIEYSNSIEYIQPNYLKGWRSFVVHGELSDGENEDEAKSKLVSKVEAWHKDFVQQPVAQMDEPVVQVDNKPNPIESMITAITTCTEVAVLKSFEKLAKSKPEFQEAYNKTMGLLTSKTN